MDRVVLLSFDIEEFDLPLEYGHEIELSTQMSVSAEGLKTVLNLLEDNDLRATFFVTANFAKHQPELIRQVAVRHEVASHGYWHSRFAEENLLSSRLVLEDITGKPVHGFRRARLATTDKQAIQRAGYRYNSSENPTWLPGRYNNLRMPRTPYVTDQLLNIPTSTVPYIRFPLFWLTFKLVPAPLIQTAMRWVLMTDQHLVLYFHSWEFSDIGEYQLPWYIHRQSGDSMVRNLTRHLSFLRRFGEFVTFTEFTEQHC